MPYCVNCGVELSDGERRCPLCKTEVLLPGGRAQADAAPPFPPHQARHAPRVGRRSVLLLLLLLFLLPVLLTVICDLNLNRMISWSGFVAGAMGFLYVAVAGPVALRGGRPVLCLCADFLALLLFLLYIERATGGVWFLKFGLPVTCAAALLSVAAMAAARRSRLSVLAVSAAIGFSVGAFCVTLEFLLNTAFSLRSHLAWSLYPLVTLSILGVILLHTDRNAALKEKLKKRFFI